MYNEKHKRIVLWAILLVIFISLALLTVVNLCIINEAKVTEERYTVVDYPYDKNNTIAEKTDPAIVVTECFSAKSVELKDSLYIANFNNTYFGTLEITFPKSLENAVTLHIVLSEAVNDRGEPWTRADMKRSFYGLGISFYEVDVEIPKGTETYRLELPERPLPVLDTIRTEDGTDYLGGVLPFCICSVSGYEEGMLSEESFTQIALHVPFDSNAGTFSSDDELLNEVFQFCKDTIKSTSYAGLYVDGYREMTPYEADAYINELGHFAIDNNYEVAKSTLEYFSEYHTWPTEWILQTISLSYEYYMYSGDVDFIRRIYPNLKQCLLEETVNKEGLLDSSLIDSELTNVFGVSRISDIIDWPQKERDGFATTVISKVSLNDKLRFWGNKYRTFIADIVGCHYTACLWRINAESGNDTTIISSPNAVVNAFYYKGLMELGAIAEGIGESDDAKVYRLKAEKFRTLYQRTFVNGNSGLVIDAVGSKHSSLHAQIFALDFDLIPEENKTTVIRYIKSKGMACSVYGAQYLLEALIKNGEAEYAIKLMTAKTETSWYNMIYRTGSKLATEAWSEKIKLNQDWNHAWGTAPVNVIIRYIVGMRPTEGGVILSPNFGNLKNVEATIPISTGSVHIDYKKTDDLSRLSVNTTGEIVYLCKDNDVTIDGSETSRDDLMELSAGNHVIEWYEGVK